MPEEIKQPEVVKNTGHKFQPGHPRYGGRKKRSPKEVRDLAEKYGADPIDYLLRLIASDTVEEVQMVDGRKTRVTVGVTTAMKTDACRIVAGYMYAKLSTTQTKLTGPDDGPIETVTFDMTKLLMDPDAVEAAQKLALMMAAQDTAPRARIGGPAIEPRTARDPSRGRVCEHPDPWYPPK